MDVSKERSEEKNTKEMSDVVVNNNVRTTTGNGTSSPCPICLQEMNEEEPTRELNCHHSFHDECVQHWFNTSRTTRCPVCRTPQDGTVNENASNDVRPMMGDEEEYEALLDFDLEHLFGNFRTSDGGSILIYESPNGIVMVRFLSVNIPQGTQLVPLFPPTSLRPLFFRRSRSFLRRVWSGVKRMWTKCTGGNVGGTNG